VQIQNCEFCNANAARDCKAKAKESGRARRKESYLLGSLYRVALLLLLLLPLLLLRCKLRVIDLWNCMLLLCCRRRFSLPRFSLVCRCSPPATSFYATSHWNTATATATLKFLPHEAACCLAAHVRPLFRAAPPVSLVPLSQCEIISRKEYFAAYLPPPLLPPKVISISSGVPRPSIFSIPFLMLFFWPISGDFFRFQLCA